jgi:uncharacterized protein (DUF2062 family)
VFFSWRGLADRLKAVCRLDDEPRKIALGLAVGVFISCTPLYGLHTLMAIGAAFALRLNKLSTVTGAWLNLPWFAPFVYALSLKVGEFILSGGQGLEAILGKGLLDLTRAIRPSLSLEKITEGFLASSKFLFMVSKPLIVGTTVIGALAGLVTYLVALGAVKEARQLARRAQGPMTTE